MKGDYPGDVQRIFNRWAPLYPIVDLFARGIREKVFHFTSPRKKAKILDVCTGTGGQAFEFGRRNFEVRGIDLSEDMLKIARRKNRYANVKFEIADASNLPYKDNYFDISCISFGLHEMPNSIREKVWKEMIRVTKPQGKIVVIDWSLPRGKIKKFLFYYFVRVFESKYFPEFVKADLQDLIERIGLKFNGSCEWASGSVKIWKYERL
jgi:demethylmenaquinone methyltransferase/2-methoxy-6-polyprenyl-1,4-benzoquinol methylase